ncbi:MULTISPECIES: aminodeoxychorismate synthase component I [Paenibacillus]|uniref:Aminodeoxychorismate synthase, component I n=1 Tax=Paenibacillus aceti TaxID=1820010 RepID=A0ABQ1W6X6_9BACL|nr:MULTISPECIES: aminodeoxychorismate synthase component I [Paenibacillus]GGG18121.1 aminodeoxychorismate synthase, component I [Paenibacillus aceti]
MYLPTGSAHVHFRDRHGTLHEYFFENPKEIIQTYNIEEVVSCLHRSEEASRQGNFVVGYVAYESAAAFDKRLLTKPATKCPLVYFAVYDREQSLDKFENYTGGEYDTGYWSSDTPASEYSEIINSIKQSIRKGDTYQTNYTIRLESHFSGDDISFYKNLCKSQKASYCAYINLGDLRVISVSPELFFEYQDNFIVTRPMKGTIARGRWYEEDFLMKQKLYQTEKERAENIMIVDLLRNDLGRIADVGSVKVSKLFEIEKYPNVYQMTSEINATTDAGLVEIFSALFPCGSITGAPKVSTMEIIESIEKSERGVYCGTIGLLLPYNHYIFNVAIRTVQIEMTNNKAVFGVGGGVTWDSSVEGEYQELINKAAVLRQDPIEFQILETLRFDGEEYYLLDFHLERMSKSADYFGYSYDREEIIKKLDAIANKCNKSLRVRVLLSQNGEINIESSEIKGKYNIINFSLSEFKIDSKNPFFYHKTTNRNIYKFNKNSCINDVLLCNERDEITEFTMGNVVLKINDTFYTPPVESGLLQGTFRRYLLENNEIQEKIIKKDELKIAQEMWFINSVQGWVRAQLVTFNESQYTRLER